jgi:hypothetical protein
MPSKFPYKVGQAVSGLIPGTALANGTVTAIRPPDQSSDYFRVRVLIVGPEGMERDYLVSASGRTDYLLPYPQRPTVNDNRVTPNERYTVTREGDGDRPWVLRYDGAAVDTADTEADAWSAANMHDYWVRNPKSTTDTAATMRDWLKNRGIRANCRVTPGRHSKSIQVYTRTHEEQFDDDAQRAIRTKALQMGLNLVRGLPIDPERMTDPSGMTFYLPGY